MTFTPPNCMSDEEVSDALRKMPHLNLYGYSTEKISITLLTHCVTTARKYVISSWRKRGPSKEISTCSILLKDRRLMQIGNLLKFGRQRDELTADWRNLHNEELHNFYFSANINTVIK
jgi:cell division protein FtsL